MRFIHVLFLALWQLTAIPFVTMLTVNTLNADTPVTASAHNYTIVYKTTAINPSAYD